jgi:hypothetical protein
MITQLVAASMAHYGALVNGPALPKKTLPPMSSGKSDRADRDDKLVDIMTRPF